MRTSAILTAVSFFTASTLPAPLAEAEAKASRPQGYGNNRNANQTTAGCPNTWYGGNTPKPDWCMSDEDAKITADVFRQLIQGYTKEMAFNALTEDFVDYSSAVSIIINKGAAEPKVSI
jgi:hypothetical protein